MAVMAIALGTVWLVDATVVRMVLVPATMKLMGHANWWLPAWLDRLLPTIDLEGASGNGDRPDAHDAPAAHARPIDELVQS